jgi:hypothetical protein
MSKPGGDPCMGFLLSSVSLFDLEISFLRPDPQVLQSRARAGAVKVGRDTSLSTSFGLARRYLDSSEHGGTLDAIGITIRGEPAFRARKSIAPHPCIRWGVQDPRTMIQSYASAGDFRDHRSLHGAQNDAIWHSITAISVLSCFRPVRDLLRSFGLCIEGGPIGSHQRRWIQFPRRRPIASSPGISSRDA